MDSVVAVVKGKRELSEMQSVPEITGVKSWCQLPEKLDSLYQIQQKLRIMFQVRARTENIQHKSLTLFLSLSWGGTEKDRSTLIEDWKCLCTVKLLYCLFLALGGDSR